MGDDLSLFFTYTVLDDSPCPRQSLFQPFKIISAHLGTPLSVDTCRDDASGIAGSLATGEQSPQGDMLKGFRTTGDAHRSRGAGLYGNDRCFLGEKATALSTKHLKSLTEARGHHLWHPKMQWTGNQSWSIRGGRQLITQFPVYEVGHALGRSGLTLSSLLPTVMLQLFLPLHHAEDIIAGDVLRAHFHHHAAVRPPCATVTGTHTVDNHLFGTCGGRYHKSSRAHTERINSPAFYLCDKTILCCRKVFSPALPTVVLYLVYQLRRMFESDTHGNALRLNLYAGSRHRGRNVLWRGRRDRAIPGSLQWQGLLPLRPPPRYWR